MAIERADDNDSLMSEADFNAASGRCCPRCGNTDIDLGTPEVDGDLVYENRECDECGARFRVFFKTDGYIMNDDEEASDGEPDEEDDGEDDGLLPINLPKGE